MPTVCPPAVRDAQWRAQGRRRGHAAAHPRAAGGGGADRIGPHRHPAPIAAAHFAPSAAAGEAGLVERFREGSWAFFRLGERRRRGDARARAHCPPRPRRRHARARPRAAVRRADATRRPRRKPISVATPRSGTAFASSMSPTRRWRTAIRGALADAPDARAARSRHRHRAHARAVRAADRARPRPRSFARHAGAGARAARPRRTAPLQRAPGRHLRPRAAEGHLRRRHHPPGAALPRRRRARDPRGGARAATRPAACWSSISLRTTSNFCATSTPTAGSASRPRP